MKTRNNHSCENKKSKTKRKCYGDQTFPVEMVTECNSMAFHNNSVKLLQPWNAFSSPISHEINCNGQLYLIVFSLPHVYADWKGCLGLISDCSMGVLEDQNCIFHCFFRSSCTSWAWPQVEAICSGRGLQRQLSSDGIQATSTDLHLHRV